MCTCALPHPRNVLLDNRFLFSDLTLFTYLACLFKGFDIYPQQCRQVFHPWTGFWGLVKLFGLTSINMLHSPPGAMTERETPQRETILWSDNRLKKPPLQSCFHASCRESLSWFHQKFLINLWVKLRVTLQKRQRAFYSEGIS